jgi:hypothetical protein
MNNTEQVILRCKDNAEALVFNKYCNNYGTDYEINVEDSYCGCDFMGIKGRFKRAWHAFFAKPVYYSGIYSDDKEKVRNWLTSCLDALDIDTTKPCTKRVYIANADE